MPLRLRSKLSTGLDPLQVVISTTTSVKNLLSTLSPSPLTAPFSAVLLILEAIQVSMTLRTVVRLVLWESCLKTSFECGTGYTDEPSWLHRPGLARGTDIDRRMRFRWNSAPEHLVQSLQKFEGILELIHKLMKRLAGSKGSDQFLGNTSIEHVLAEHSRLLDEAAQSLQLATLIDLPDTVDTLSRSNTGRTPRSRL